MNRYTSRRDFIGAAAAVSASLAMSDRVLARMAATGRGLASSDGATGDASSFEFGLLRQVGATQEAGVNTTVSPSSVLVALCMLQLGADRAFSQALQQLVSGNRQPRIDFEALRRSTASLNAQEGKDPALQGFALACVGEDVDVASPVRAGLTSLHAAVERLDLSKQSTIDAINATVRSRTRGRIASLLERPEPNTGIILLNAFAFQAPWATPFVADETTDADFTSPRGRTRVKMMRMTETPSLPAAVQGAFTAVDLPYKDPRFSMRFISRSGAPARLADFAPIAGWMRGDPFRERPVSLAMPRFTVRGGQDLLPVLDRRGLSPARQAAGALRAFTGKDRAIQAIVQKVMLGVDEGGTVAAAATAVAVPPGATAPLPGLLDVVLDRPFLFALLDRRLKLCLMAGYMEAPQA